MFRYWIVDSFTSGVTPGSPPPDGQVPNAVGRGRHRRRAARRCPCCRCSSAPLPTTVPLPPRARRVLAILPSQASSPDGRREQATASRA